jgi:DNA repair exonuclease SbcCD nuclease subunit
VIQVAIITDTHYGARSESRTFSDYFNRFLNDVFFPEIERRGITTVIHLGDLVDRRKFVNYVAADRMLRSFVDRLNNKRLIITVGNHDMPYRDTLDANAVEVLLSHRDNVTIIREPTFTEYGLIVPWICAENKDAVNEAIATAHKKKVRTVMGHFEMAGFERQRGDVADSGIDPAVFYGFETVLSGHYHHKSDKLNIHYLGAPYEITWNDYNDEKGFHIFDPDTLELEFRKNPYRMHYKLEYDDRSEKRCLPDKAELQGKAVKVVVVTRTDPARFDEYMRELERAECANVQVIDNHLLKLTEDNADEQADADLKDTLDVLISCLDGVSDRVDKPRLRTFLTELYRDAAKVTA